MSALVVTVGTMNIDTLATPAASTSDAEVHAARFTIGDITMVRLVPTKLLHVTETVLETVGLTLATTRQVGRTAATQPMDSSTGWLFIAPTICRLSYPTWVNSVEHKMPSPANQPG